MPNELQTSRGRFFFWIGLAVLPVFWLWWMSERHFTRRQIWCARVWCLFYVVAVNAAWVLIPYFREQITELRWTYSMVAFWIGLSLWVWLFWRVFRITIVELLVPCFAILPYLGFCGRSSAQSNEPSSTFPVLHSRSRRRPSPGGAHAPISAGTVLTGRRLD
jgi:uncharacterized membrane protein